MLVAAAVTSLRECLSSVCASLRLHLILLLLQILKVLLVIAISQFFLETVFVAWLVQEETPVGGLVASVARLLTSNFSEVIVSSMPLTIIELIGAVELRVCVLSSGEFSDLSRILGVVVVSNWCSSFSSKRRVPERLLMRDRAVLASVVETGRAMIVFAVADDIICDHVSSGDAAIAALDSSVMYRFISRIPERIPVRWLAKQIQLFHLIRPVSRSTLPLRVQLRMPHCRVDTSRVCA